MMETYGNGHKLFLQTIMSRGIMNVTDVKEVLTELGADTKEKIFAFVRTVNTHIAPINLEIRKGVEEEDGQHFYVLANTVETPISRLSSTYTINELELFKKLVESIVTSDEGMIGSLAAINLTDRLEKKMGKEEAQIFLNRLEDDKWIRKNTNGKITLSVRTIVELEQYIKEVYQDFVKLCKLCTKVCLLGQECANCGGKFHHRCFNVYMNKRGQGDKTCPESNCGALWGQVII